MPFLQFSEDWLIQWKSCKILRNCAKHRKSSSEQTRQKSKFFKILPVNLGFFNRHYILIASYLNSYKYSYLSLSSRQKVGVYRHYLSYRSTI